MLFGPSESEYFWCLHCERTYKNGEFREVTRRGEILQMCPYEDCSGDGVMDSWEWDKILEESDKDLPQIPERGVEYKIQ